MAHVIFRRQQFRVEQFRVEQFLVQQLLIAATSRTIFIPKSQRRRQTDNGGPAQYDRE